MFLIKYILSCYSYFVNKTSFTEIAHEIVMKESTQVPFKTEDITARKRRSKQTTALAYLKINSVEDSINLLFHQAKH